MKTTVTRLSLCIAITLGLSSCELLGPHLGKKIPLEIKQIQEPPPEEAEETTPPEAQKAQAGLEKPEIYTAKPTFIRPVPTPKVSEKAGQYTLNFDDADLGEVAKVILGDILKHNYILSPKAGGKITLQTTRPLRKDEVLPTLEMLLRMNGLALVMRDGYYWIGPATEAAAGAPIGVAGNQKMPAGYQIRIIPLRYVGVAAMEKILKPLLPPRGLLFSDPTRNLIMVAGSAAELKHVEETVHAFDVNFLQGMSVGLFPLKNVDVETLAGDLEKILGEKTLGKDTGLLKILPLKRLNALMVITAQPEYLKLAETWIARLDRTITEASGDVHVYRAQNVDAVKLADTLNQIFTGKGKAKTPPTKLAPGQKKATLKSKTKAPAPTFKASSSPASGDIRIIADEPNNALVIIADQEDYKAIERVIKQLDRVPLQVLIDASIFEVTLSDELRYGVEWFIQNKLPKNHSLLGLREGGVVNLTEAAKDGLLTSLTGGFSYLFMNKSQDLGVLLKALARDNKLHVVSSPSMMVLNNHEASIKVGDQVTLVTGEVAPNTGAANVGGVTRSFQQRDTGVLLTIKPRVNAGGLVIMELDQKVDDVGRATINNNPVIRQRQMKSTVAVKSGDTLVLGGLIKDNTERAKQGVPLLHKLPLIGPLFGSTTKTFNRTELIALITPRVVERRRDVYAITNEYKQRLREIYEIPSAYIENRGDTSLLYPPEEKGNAEGSHKNQPTQNRQRHSGIDTGSGDQRINSHRGQHGAALRPVLDGDGTATTYPLVPEVLQGGVDGNDKNAPAHANGE